MNTAQPSSPGADNEAVPLPPAQPPGRFELRWYAVARAALAGFCRTFWRAKVIGREHVPTDRAFVLSPSHRSYVDTMICACVTTRRLRFMGKDTLWKYRWSARLVSSLGAFPVRRWTTDREALRHCEEFITAGEPVVIYPEGTRKAGPVIQPLRDGAAFVAARTGVPIVPVGIGGSEWAMPKGARFLHPVKVAVVIGRPLEPPARTAGARVSRRAVAEVTDSLHAELQRLFDEASRLAGRA